MAARNTKKSKPASRGAAKSRAARSAGPLTRSERTDEAEIPIERLRHELAVGAASGDAGPLDFAAIKRKARLILDSQRDEN